MKIVIFQICFLYFFFGDHVTWTHIQKKIINGKRATVVPVRMRSICEWWDCWQYSPFYVGLAYLRCQLVRGAQKAQQNERSDKMSCFFRDLENLMIDWLSSISFLCSASILFMSQMDWFFIMILSSGVDRIVLKWSF